MNKKAQAAMEFLMTYGWAILVVLIVIGALAYFGVLTPTALLPEKCVLPIGLQCEQVMVQQGEANFKVRNGFGKKITITSFKMLDDNGLAVCMSSDNSVIREGKTANFRLLCEPNTRAGRKEKYTVELEYYEKSSAAFTHTVEGEIIARIEKGGAIAIPGRIHLVARYSLEDNVEDTAGGHNGSNFNTITQSGCKRDKCFNFNGINSYLRVPASTDLNPGAEGLTYAAWIKPTAIPLEFNMIMGRSLPYLCVRNSGLVFFSFRANGLQEGIWGSTVLEMDTWYYVVATYDADGYGKVYVNGVEDGSGGPYTPFNNYDNDLFMGQYTSGGVFWFTGLIDEVMIWNKALSADDVSDLYYGYS